MEPKAHGRDEREFARVPVTMAARFRLVEGAEAEALAERLRERPSVWTLREEATLRSLASSSGDDARGAVARALLDLAEQVSRLSYRVLESGGPAQAATILQVSGGGGRLRAEPILEPGQLLDLRLDDHETGVPPVRALVEVVHAGGPQGYGFRFSAIHPADQDRLIRFIYQLQRESLRRSQIRKTPES